jgi:hypothetical protein
MNGRKLSAKKINHKCFFVFVGDFFSTNQTCTKVLKKQENCSSVFKTKKAIENFLAIKGICLFFFYFILLPKT